MKKKLTFIVNPFAGIRSKESFPKLVERLLDPQLFEYEIIYTERAGHAVELSKQALNNGRHMVVAVGGDGTIHEVSRSLIDSSTALGIIPSGSGNGLARHLEIPLSAEKAIQCINENHLIHIDTVKLNAEYFVSIAGVGFDALVSDYFAKSKIRGFLSYFSIVVKQYLGYKPGSYRIHFEDKELETKALFISFANSGQFGFNTVISPEADISDGFVDICIAQKPPLGAIPRIIRYVFTHKIHKSRYINILQANKLKVEFDKHGFINLDGEPIKMQSPLNIEVNPLSLQVAVPKNTQK